MIAPRARRRAVVILGLIALAAIAPLIIRPAGPGALRSVSHSHEWSLVRSVAPHLGGVGEILLQRDCGRCHAPASQFVAGADVPRMQPRAPTCLSADQSGSGIGSQSCVRCHGSSGEASGT